MLIKQRGSAFAEVIVSLLIIQIILVAIVPTFMYSNNQTAKNRLKTVAYNLANEQLEWIKSLPYDDVGIIGGNPSGTLQADQDINKNGLKFHLKTRVKWIDDSFDESAPLDSDPRDYKQVTLTLTELTGSYPQAITLTTMISRQSEEQIANGGNIQVKAKKLDSTAIEDVKVDILTGPSAPLSDYTDETGTTLFSVLSPSISEGDYTVTVSKNGYVVQPNLATQTTTVNIGEIRYLEFIMEQPGNLLVHLVDDKGRVIDKSSNITLINSDSGELSFNSNDGNYNIVDMFPGKWNITAKAASFQAAEALAEITPGNTTEITITLLPKDKGNLHLQVFDKTTNQAIPFAAVKITNLSTNEAITEQTNTQGILETQLETGMHQVEISKDGYLAASQDIEITKSGNTFLNAYLEPAPQVGSILVRAETLDGTPRNDVWIRVRLNGTGTTYLLRTGTYQPGEALLENLPPGQYIIHRNRWGWRDLRRVNVAAGQQSRVVYRY